MMTGSIPRAIKKIFHDKGYIDYVILFGSAAKNQLRENSDIDIFVGGNMTFDQRVVLMADLGGQLKRNIDIVLNKEAVNEVALSAFAKGIPIIVRNKEKLRKDYFKHYYAFEDSLYLRKIKEAKINRSFNGR